MTSLPQPLFDAVCAALTEAGRADLVAQLAQHGPKDSLTSGQAAELLGVASANTVKNWLESGQFPGAFQTSGGHWRFPRAEVEAVKARMDALRHKNLRGDLTPPDAVDAPEEER